MENRPAMNSRDYHQDDLKADLHRSIIKIVLKGSQITESDLTELANKDFDSPLIPQLRIVLQKKNSPLYETHAWNEMRCNFIPEFGELADENELLCNRSLQHSNLSDQNNYLSMNSQALVTTCTERIVKTFAGDSREDKELSINKGISMLRDEVISKKLCDQRYQKKLKTIRINGGLDYLARGNERDRSDKIDLTQLIFTLMYYRMQYTDNLERFEMSWFELVSTKTKVKFFQIFGPECKFQKTLTELCLAACNITDDDLENFLNNFKQCKMEKLQIINFKSNDISYTAEMLINHVKIFYANQPITIYLDRNKKIDSQMKQNIYSSISGIDTIKVSLDK
jgi:hypothetical protein